jgi:hypothetical protein
MAVTFTDWVEDGVNFKQRDRVARAAVCLRCEKELDVPELVDPNDPNPVYLWWD